MNEVRERCRSGICERVVEGSIEWSDVKFGNPARSQKGRSNHSEGYYNEYLVELLQIKTQTLNYSRFSKVPAVPKG
jgi:hypothetical protein